MKLKTKPIRVTLISITLVLSMIGCGKQETTKVVESDVEISNQQEEQEQISTPSQTPYPNIEETIPIPTPTASFEYSVEDYLNRTFVFDKLPGYFYMGGDVYKEVTSSYLAYEFKENHDGEIIVPVILLANEDDKNIDDITILGDFWIFSYNQNKENHALIEISSERHRGNFHLKMTDSGYDVVLFDEIDEDKDDRIELARICENSSELIGKFLAFTEDDLENEKTQNLTNYVKHYKARIDKYININDKIIRLTNIPDYSNIVDENGNGDNVESIQEIIVKNFLKENYDFDAEDIDTNISYSEFGITGGLYMYTFVCKDNNGNEKIVTYQSYEDFSERTKELLQVRE